MSILAAVLLVILGLVGILCIIVTMVVCIVIAERTRTIPEISARIDNVETYLEELVEDVNADLGMPPEYAMGDGSPMPTDIQNIMNKMGMGETVNQDEIDKLENFFNDANDTFSDDDDEDEEDKPWKKK